MAGRSKRFKEIDGKLEEGKIYSIKEGLSFLKSLPKLKFDESVDVALKLGVDPKKSDQQVRGTVALPNGTGKDVIVVVLTKGEQAKAAEAAGANFVGSADIIEKIKGGWTSFDSLIVTPDMMRDVGKLGKILGPRGLMPTPKAGTVTTDVAKAVKEIKAGKVEYKVDKNCVINNMVGKLSFDDASLLQNVETLVEAISKSKPPTSKGQYLKSLFISSTMGPGLKIDLQSLLTS